MGIKLSVSLKVSLVCKNIQDLIDLGLSQNFEAAFLKIKFHTPFSKNFIWVWKIILDEFLFYR